MNNGKLFVISAPSGTGKTTLLKKVVSELPKLRFSVSHTTRKPREGETNSVDYHFVSEEEFLALRDKEGFLESAHVHQNYYGTSKQAVSSLLTQGVDVVLDIDVQGATILMKNKNIEASFIFIAPPDLKELERRLITRGSDSEETIKLRMNNAKGELESAAQYDYLIVNNDLREAKQLLASVILAERARLRRSFAGDPVSITV